MSGTPKLVPKKVTLSFDDVIRRCLPSDAAPHADQVEIRVREPKTEKEIALGTFGEEVVIAWYEPEVPAALPGDAN